LHRAINERQFTDVEPLIDEDIDWTIHGPVDLFPFLGSRHGKAAVMEVLRQIADKVGCTVLIASRSCWEWNRRPSMLRYSLTVLDTNKPIKLRLAHFAQFREGKLSSLRILIDTYELVEQAFGMPLRKRQLASA
jgi:hypothetical protein